MVLKGRVLTRNKINLENFQGRWTILREIRDELNGQTGRLEGQATFRPDEQDPESLIYEERGLLQMEGSPALHAERKYRWSLVGAGNTISVSFEDGRPFHSLDLDRTMPFDTHVCSPDIYEVSYDFRSWPVWRVEWRVQGPKKDYRLWTRFRFMGDVTFRGRSCVGPLARANDQRQSTKANEGDEWLSTLQTES